MKMILLTVIGELILGAVTVNFAMGDRAIPAFTVRADTINSANGVKKPVASEPVASESASADLPSPELTFDVPAPADATVMPQPAIQQPAPAPPPPTGVLSPGKLVLGYWARWGNESWPRRSLELALDTLDIVSPYWFTMKKDGSLTARESGHREWLDQVHVRGKQVLLLVNNGSNIRNVLTDPEVRARAVDNLQQRVKEYGVAGVHLDFEGLPPDLRDPLTEFVTAVADRLRPEGLLTTVAVGPKTSASSADNDGAIAYDYEALGQVSDLIVLMTYDQYGPLTGSGPVAGLPWVERVVGYAVTVIPREKLLLGIAGYGYDWSNAGVQVLPAREAAQRAGRFGAAVGWDEANSQPHFKYIDEHGLTHQVWFESATGASHKLALANRYGLRGVALWSLGQEAEDLWPLLAGNLN